MIGVSQSEIDSDIAAAIEETRASRRHDA